MSRDTTLLHPVLQGKLKEFLAACDKAGLKVSIVETFRTKAEQDALYAKGRTVKGSIVTNAKYPQSQHCWHTAFDFCRNDGQGAYNESGDFFTKVGKVGQSVGLEWGGAWTSFKDKPHFQLKGTEYNWKNLQAKYSTPEKYKATWAKADTIKETPTMTTATRNETAIAEAKTIIGKLGKIIEISDVNTAVLQLADNYNNSVWWILKKLADKV